MLALVTATQVVQPNALDAFAGSLEPGQTLRARGKVWVPEGAEGEVLLRRVMLEGWNTAGVALWLSVYVNGAEVTQLRTYLSRPANPAADRSRRSRTEPILRRASRATRKMPQRSRSTSRDFTTSSRPRHSSR